MIEVYLAVGGNAAVIGPRIPDEIEGAFVAPVSIIAAGRRACMGDHRRVSVADL
ncbi:MAG: hypothetical protein V3U18_05990 [Alphaproteobacteria bacterium]